MNGKEHGNYYLGFRVYANANGVLLDIWGFDHPIMENQRKRRNMKCKPEVRLKGHIGT